MNTSVQMDEFAIGSGFNFSGQIIDELDASEYTLATILLDESSSVGGKQDQIRDMLVAAVGACYSSPYSSNLMVRVGSFSSRYTRGGSAGGVDELHGFKTLAEIDVNAYPALKPGGSTPLNDAVYSGVGAANTYAQQLSDMDFGVNGITIIVTDGGENSSVATTSMVKEELQKAVKGEVMESHLSILVGIDNGYGNVSDVLDAYQRDTGIDKFIWAGEATKGKLAKLAEFVSQSISSTSQALGTGGPSQNISATI